MVDDLSLSVETLRDVSSGQEPQTANIWSLGIVKRDCKIKHKKIQQEDQKFYRIKHYKLQFTQQLLFRNGIETLNLPLDTWKHTQNLKYCELCQ